MLLQAVALLTAALQAVAAAQAATQDSGRTLTLGGVSYFVPPSPVSALHDGIALSIAAKSASGGLVPFSVIPTSKFVFDSGSLQDVVDDYSAKDDVWSKEFLTGMPHTLLRTARLAHLRCHTRHLCYLQRHSSSSVYVAPHSTKEVRHRLCLLFEELPARRRPHEKAACRTVLLETCVWQHIRG